jgi:hypothetical protein
MSNDWYLMTTPSQVSGFENDYFADYATSSFNELLATFVGEDIILYNSDLSIQTAIKGIMQSKYQKQSEMQILLPLNSCEIGMYIKHKGLYWLIIDFVNNNKMYQKAIIQLCNYTLKFQSPSGTILSYPCIDESSNTVGIDETDTINTLNGVKRIKCPFCLDTDRIKVDDRFFVDKSNRAVYKVSNVNNTEFNYGDKGLVVLTMKADEIQADDRADLGICDYFINPIPPTPTGSYSVITCSNPSNELTIGSSVYRTLTATFYNSGVINTSIVPIWSFEFPSGFNSCFSVVYEGKLAKIKVLENYDLLGKTIKVNVANSSGAYTSSLILKITM